MGARDLVHVREQPVDLVVLVVVRGVVWFKIDLAAAAGRIIRPARRGGRARSSS